MILATVVSVALLLNGCAPASPDHRDWNDQAAQALSDAVSDVSTVHLVLRLERRGDLAQNYQQTVVLDSEEKVGLAAQKLGGLQPPVRDDAAYRRVTSALSDASDLLAQVRIAVVREETGRYDGLLGELAKTRTDLLEAKASLP